MSLGTALLAILGIVSVWGSSISTVFNKVSKWLQMALHCTRQRVAPVVVRNVVALRFAHPISTSGNAQIRKCFHLVVRFFHIAFWTVNGTSCHTQSHASSGLCLINSAMCMCSVVVRTLSASTPLLGWLLMTVAQFQLTCSCVSALPGHMNTLSGHIVMVLN